jgi:hypothetical protein
LSYEEIDMAALLIVRIFGTRAAPRAAAFLPAPRSAPRRSLGLSAAVTKVLSAGGECLLFLWMLTVAAFALVVVGGFLQT